MKKEKHAFTMHQALLKSVIFEQAGTREKAILEGVMNAVDAGSSKITITLNETGLVIEDDGRGFQSEEELKEHFQSFGTPHVEGDAKYGKFRMGRGQLFAKGKNVWRTRTYRMTVDAKKELSYHLEKGLEDVPGCRIEVAWYDRLNVAEQNDIGISLARMIAYVEVPVTINGKLVSKLPSTQKWDLETDDGYFKFHSTASLRIYNLGVHVEELHNGKLGIGGVFVSKKQLKVNFARNQVMSECPVWKAALKEFKARSAVKRERKATKKQELTDGEREAAARSFAAAELPDNQMLDLRVFTDVTGAHWSLRQIDAWLRKGDCRIVTTAEREGDMRGDRLMQQRLAFVFSPDTWERFGFTTAEELIALTKRAEWKDGRYVGENGPLAGRYRLARALQHWTVKPYEELTEHLDDTHVLIPEIDWTPTQKLIVEVIRGAEVHLRREAGRWQESQTERKIVLGESDSANGWTDGTSYIAINANLVGDSDMDIRSWHRIGNLLLHEYCHDDSTITGCTHGKDFFQRYHDLTKGGVVGNFVHAAIYGFNQVLEREGRRMQRELVRMAERDVKKKKLLEEWEENRAKLEVLRAADSK